MSSIRIHRKFVDDDKSDRKDDSKWRLRVLRYVKRVLFFYISYPSVDMDKIVGKPEVIEGVPDSEIKECLEVSKRSRGIFLLNITVYALYFIKNNPITTRSLLLYHPFISKTSESETLNGSLGNGQSHYQSGCLGTNCTRLTKASSLALDMNRLPELSICRPDVSTFYSPDTYMDSVGLFFLAVVSYQVLVICISLILVQYKFAAGCDTLMFALAPNLTTNQVRDKLKNLVMSFNKSFLNFRPFPAEPYPRGGSSARGLRDKVWGLRYQLNACSPGRNSDEIQAKEDLRELIEDCLPAIRSKWWSPRLMKLFLILLVTTFGILFSSAVVLFSFIHVELEWRRETFRTMAEEMREQDCSLWCRLSGQVQSSVNLGQVYVGWTMFSIMEFMAVVLPAFCVPIIMVVCFFASICELSCWLAELNMQIALAVELGKFQRGADRPVEVKCSKKARNVLSSIREIYKQSSYLDLVTPSTKPLARGPTKSETRDTELKGVETAYRELVLKLMVKRDRYGSESYHELIKRVYISFRLFVDIVNCFSPNIINIVFISLLTNYGTVIGGLWGSREIRDRYNLDPLAVASTAYISSSILILAAAKFHAMARKIHPLLWTLVAQLTDSKDIEIQHVRLLFLKQIRVLDSEGGIALKTYMFRITYVNIIQLWIWTASIMVLSP